VGPCVPREIKGTRPWSGRQNLFRQSEMALLFAPPEKCCQNCLTRTGVVRDSMTRSVDTILIEVMPLKGGNGDGIASRFQMIFARLGNPVYRANDPTNALRLPCRSHETPRPGPL